MKLYDCLTTKEVGVKGNYQNAIQVVLTGGNQCVYFNETIQKF